MPALPWLIAAGLVGAWLGGQADDALEGTPSPLSTTGLVVWGLAGFGALALARRVLR